MDKILEMLKKIRPDIDFASEKTLVDDGLLDSVDVMSIVAALKDSFGVVVSMAELDPDDFNSAETILALVERKKANG